MQQIVDTKKCSKCGAKKPASIKYFYKLSGAKDGLRNTCKECTSQFHKKCYASNPQIYKVRHEKYHKANPEKCRVANKKWRKANPEKRNAIQKKWRKANPEKANATVKKWRKANPEKANATVKKWRKANPEKVKAYSKKYCEANPEKYRAINKKYYEANPEKVKARRKKYRESNPEKIKTYHKKWQSTTKGIFTVMKANKHNAWKFTFEEFDQWYKSQPNTCCYCDITAENYHKLPWRKNKLTTRLSLDRIEPSLFYEPNNVKLCCLDCNSTKSNFFTYDEMREIAQKYIKPKWQKELDVLQ